MSPEKQVLNILMMLQDEYPDAGTMLRYNSEFELVLAVLLSAQSTDEQVNRVTGKLFEKYKEPADFVQIDLSELEELIKGVGLYRSKAKNIKKMSSMILDKFGGKVPRDFSSLLQLPGIGRKSANVILAVAFNQPGLGVDRHVHRVANRMGLVCEKKPVKTEMELKKLIPEEMWGKAHHLFIFHGRKICKARKPDCSKCAVRNLCRQKTVSP